jgi:hypothetical protein
MLNKEWIKVMMNDVRLSRKEGVEYGRVLYKDRLGELIIGTKSRERLTLIFSFSMSSWDEWIGVFHVHPTDFEKRNSYFSYNDIISILRCDCELNRIIKYNVLGYMIRGVPILKVFEAKGIDIDKRTLEDIKILMKCQRSNQWKDGWYKRLNLDAYVGMENIFKQYYNLEIVRGDGYADE